MSKYEHIRLAHGSGGKLSLELIQELFVSTFASKSLTELSDAAIIKNHGGRLAFATDSHSVQPLFFPGGDIGRLAVAGTVNDLAVMGAVPKYLSSSFIIEEGFAMDKLEKIVKSMKATADEAEVEIVTGDTKVVERGKGDGLFINTSGIGFLAANRNISSSQIQIGDVLLTNGSLGDHGIAVMTQRKGFELNLGLESDVRPLNGLISELLANVPDVHFMRDITRGGLAAIANELVIGQNYGIRIFEENIPLKPDVVEYAEMLGIDPLLAANEGKIIVAVKPEAAQKALASLRQHPFGKEAAIIGDVVKKPLGKAVVQTAYGSLRLLEMPIEEQLPRIC